MSQSLASCWCACCIARFRSRRCRTTRVMCGRRPFVKCRVGMAAIAVGLQETDRPEAHKGVATPCSSLDPPSLQLHSPVVLGGDLIVGGPARMDGLCLLGRRLHPGPAIAGVAPVVCRVILGRRVKVLGPLRIRSSLPDDRRSGMRAHCAPSRFMRCLLISKSRCHWVLLGSRAANRSAMARFSR